MNLPALNGIIDRRILINYRAKPATVQRLLPPGLEPLVVNGYASAGICLLRLKDIGVKYTPSVLRVASENAAHRFLIRYRDGRQQAQGVYIPRRDTDSALNVILAGKLFSWPHFPASFAVNESRGNYSIDMRSADGLHTLHVDAERTNTFPSDSMFDSIEQASECFFRCAVGLSPSTKKDKLKKILLRTKTWAVSPLRIHSLKSSYFEDQINFPDGSIAFDNALLMENIVHEWVEPDA